MEDFEKAITISRKIIREELGYQLGREPTEKELQSFIEYLEVDIKIGKKVHILEFHSGMRITHKVYENGKLILKEEGIVCPEQL